jgi:hypothetical protein
MAGRMSGLKTNLDAFSRIADELGQPSHLWEVHAGRAALTLAAGKLTEAEELSAQAFAFGEHAKPDVAIPVVRLQRYTLCEFRGNLKEVEPEIRALVAEYPARPAFRCTLVHLHAWVGRLPEARQALADFVRDDCSALPFDQEWLYGMSFLAESSALLGDSDSAAVLYELLLRYPTFNAADWPEGIRGSVSRYLGLLATTTKRWHDAEVHFEAGLAMNAEWGFRPWLAYTQHDYARMLQERGEPGDSERAGELLASSKALSQEVGMTALTSEISSLPH